MTANVSICVRAGLSKLRAVPDTERNKDTKTLDYASTPLDANTLLVAVARLLNLLVDTICILFRPSKLVRLMILIFEQELRFQ
jgi:hypothetical protein